jgi:Xaa-Pro aminopeptidase
MTFVALIGAGVIRIARVQVLMEAMQLDAVVASTWENLTYLSDVYIYTQRAIPSRRSALLLPIEGDAMYIFCSIEDAQIRDSTWIDDLRGYREFSEDPIELLIDEIRRRRFHGKRVGLERRYLGADIVDRIEAGAPAPEYVDAGSFFEQLRAAKRPDELVVMEKAATATREGFGFSTPPQQSAPLTPGQWHEKVTMGPAWGDSSSPPGVPEAPPTSAACYLVR